MRIYLENLKKATQLGHEAAQKELKMQGQSCQGWQFLNISDFNSFYDKSLICLKVIFHYLCKKISTIDWRKHIKSDHNVMFGKPVIAGTRIPVDLILEKMALGMSIKELLIAYPNTCEEDMKACLFFAAESVKYEVVYAA